MDTSEEGAHLEVIFHLEFAQPKGWTVVQNNEGNEGNPLLKAEASHAYQWVIDGRISLSTVFCAMFYAPKRPGLGKG